MICSLFQRRKYWTECFEAIYALMRWNIILKKTLNIQCFWEQTENVSWREENPSQLINSWHFCYKYWVNTQIVEVIIKNKKNRLFCKTTVYSVLYYVFCTSPVENVSFVLETEDLPRKINSSCIFFLTKRYCLCGLNFAWNYFEVYSLVKFLGSFTFKIIFWSQTVSSQNL